MFDYRVALRGQKYRCCHAIGRVDLSRPKLNNVLNHSPIFFSFSFFFFKYNFSCNLSRNGFGRCRVCYTGKCFMQVIHIPATMSPKLARQVVRNISQCNSAVKKEGNGTVH